MDTLTHDSFNRKYVVNKWFNAISRKHYW